MLSGDGRGTFVQKPEVATVLAFRTTAEGRSDLVVVGPRTRGSYNPGKALPVCVRLRLRPGRARAVLGVPVHELVDQAVSLGDLWGQAGRTLTSALVGADGPRVASRLAGALPPESGHPLVETVMRELSRPADDFRSIMGVSPGAFLAGRLPAVTPCGYPPARRGSA